jgi:hypothetical protein
MRNSFGASTLHNLAPTAARTTTGQGAAVDVRDLEGPWALLLDAAAGTGTAPTLDVKLQDSDDGSTGWGDVAGVAFAQVAAVASRQRIVCVTNTKRYVRAAWTIGGTTPSFTFSVNALGINKSV